MEAIVALLMSLLGKYPLIGSILMVMGILRSVFKPLFALARAYVSASPSAKDDAALDGIEKSAIYKGLAFALDYLASIKLPGAK